MFFDKKAREVETMMTAQFEQIEHILVKLEAMIQDYINHDKLFKKESFEVHTGEHDADKIRRDIGAKLYQGAFLPVYREDYYRIVEMADNIADKAEAIADFITLTRPLVPDFAKERMVQLVSKNVATFALVRQLLAEFLNGDEHLMETAQAIQNAESEIDSDQFYLTRSIFKSSLEKIEKIHTKNLIDQICKVSDLAEDLSDQFEIIAAKQNL